MDWRNDDGSAVVEFTLVTVLLTLLTVSVLQLGLALHVRNTVTDAAAEGARFAALADNGLADGVERTRELITTAVGSDFAGDITASYGTYLGHASTEIRVVTTLPVIGLLGLDKGLEVDAHAAVETLDDAE
ncbi:pilus assembly protein [Mycetocola zhadangensis]|uniref:Pilus assembly protein n=1 Tax=Mycetocola zhadangensis TaxID=1164595 RepID=A0A3L7J6Z7_9MICO|nr:pilus assembly protein [Mycetocola zhadangensis]